MVESRFRLLIDMVCNECEMTNKISFEASNEILRDSRRNIKFFGNKTILFAGEFKQILGVFIKGTRSDEVSGCS